MIDVDTARQDAHLRPVAAHARVST